LVENVRAIAEVRSEGTRQVLLSLTVDELTPARILRLKEVVADYSGPCVMELKVTAPGHFSSTVVFGDKFGVRADEGLLLALERLFGGQVARLV
jgi:hypothetical protein